MAAIGLAGCGQSEEEQAVEDVQEAIEDSGLETGEPAREVSAEEAETWPDKWCNEVEVGMTQDEIQEIMGEPTRESAEQDQWEAYEHSLTAFYNADGTARIPQTNNEPDPCPTRFE